MDLQPGQRHDQGQLRRAACGDAVLHQLPRRRAAAVQRQCAARPPRLPAGWPGLLGQRAHLNGGLEGRRVRYTLPHMRCLLVNAQAAELAAYGLCSDGGVMPALQRRSCRSGSCRSRCACPRRTCNACSTPCPAPSTRCAAPSPAKSTLAWTAHIFCTVKPAAHQQSIDSTGGIRAQPS